MEEDKKHGTLIWIILIVNLATFILLIILLITGWNTSSQKTTPTSTTTSVIQPNPIQQTGQTNGQQPPVGGQGQPPSGMSAGGKCGDNVCDALEKANPSVCPADCK